MDICSTVAQPLPTSRDRPQATVTGPDGAERDVLVAKDEGVRAGTTAEKLGKLKAVFKKEGTTTAGNSSQVHDNVVAVGYASLGG